MATPKVNNAPKGKKLNAEKAKLNYRSENTGSGSKELTNELTFGAARKLGMHFSSVLNLNNEKKTPYMWMSDTTGELIPEGYSDQIFFSKKGKNLFEDLGGVSKSKHVVRYFDVTDKKGDIAELVLICDIEEVGGSADLELVD
jgi:hypothetical protein